MELSLKINNKTKKFKLPSPTFAIMLRTAELMKKIEQDEFLSDKSTDEQVYEDVLILRDFIIYAFGNQFSAEEFNEGYISEDLSDFFALGRMVLYEVMINPKKLENLSDTVLTK